MSDTISISDFVGPGEYYFLMNGKYNIGIKLSDPGRLILLNNMNRSIKPGIFYTEFNDKINEYINDNPNSILISSDMPQ